MRCAGLVDQIVNIVPFQLPQKRIVNQHILHHVFTFMLCIFPAQFVATNRN